MMMSATREWADQLPAVVVERACACACASPGDCPREVRPARPKPRAGFLLPAKPRLFQAQSRDIHSILPALPACGASRSNSNSCSKLDRQAGKTGQVIGRVLLDTSWKGTALGINAWESQDGIVLSQLQVPMGPQAACHDCRATSPSLARIAFSLPELDRLSLPRPRHYRTRPSGNKRQASGTREKLHPCAGSPTDHILKPSSLITQNTGRTLIQYLVNCFTTLR